VEATALKHTVPVGMRGPSPLLRLQSDERLIALVRRGNHAAFETLVARYQSRLLAFCRHMLGSREDAEDVLQEVFAAAFNAIVADDRPIHVRPWLYRIARNRSLNHLRRVQPIGVDSMDIHMSDAGLTTADKVHKREDFRLLVSDVQDLPETQKTALLLREIDALSYEQIAEAMETTIPSVKSLLVRARVSLAECAEARTLTCEQVREELGEVSEGLRRSTAPVRRHVRGCDRCQGFKAQLRSTNKALAAVFPVAPLLLFKKALLTQFGMTASAGAGGAAGAAAATVAATGGTSAMSAGISTIATKAAATLAAAAIVTASVAEVKHVQTKVPAPAAAAATPKPAPVAHAAPEVVAAVQQPTRPAPVRSHSVATAASAKADPKPAGATVASTADHPAGPAPDVVASADAGPVTGGPASTSATPTAPVQGVTETTTLSHAAGPPAQTGGAAAPSEPGVAPIPANTPVQAAAPSATATPPPAVIEPNPDATPAAPGSGGIKATP
jgi:RNA polymerase sigma factor (sigma-70 family)